MVEVWVYDHLGWYKTWTYPWWDTTPKRRESEEAGDG